MQTPSSQEQTRGALIRGATKGIVDAIAGGLVRLGIGANALTSLGLVLSGVAGWLAAIGAYGYAGLAYMLGASLDALDGPVARISQRANAFGALFDSVLDRYGETFLLAGLGYHLAREGAWDGLILAFVALAGSYMVSYVRARSEALGIANEVGLLTRLERCILIIIALLSGQVIIGLWVLAVLTQVTVIQRVWHTYRFTRKGQP
jgi:CDP-diacylglycerol--glycerol-3-phosphate 3-phosphatidyltransferase